MAYDRSVAEVLRAALAGTDGIVERRMFGALCFMLRGNMSAGRCRDGGFFRVGKPRRAGGAGAARRAADADARPADARDRAGAAGRRGRSRAARPAAGAGACLRRAAAGEVAARSLPRLSSRRGSA